MTLLWFSQSRVFGDDEIEELCTCIGQLSPAQQATVAKIAKLNVEQNEEEVELNLYSLSKETLVEIQQFVNSCLKKTKAIKTGIMISASMKHQFCIDFSYLFCYYLI